MNQPYKQALDQLNQYLLKTYGNVEHNKDIDISKLQINNVQLDPKVKQMIALSVGIAVGCDGCIDSHIKQLKQLGLKRSELLALLGIAVYIGGGASLMHAADALIAYGEDTDKEEEFISR